MRVAGPRPLRRTKPHRALLDLGAHPNVRRDSATILAPGPPANAPGADAGCCPLARGRAKPPAGRHTLTEDDQGRHFIDRDGAHFRHILNYLRSVGSADGFALPADTGVRAELRIEAEYYQMQGLMELIDAAAGRVCTYQGPPEDDKNGVLFQLGTALGTKPYALPTESGAVRVVFRENFATEWSNAPEDLNDASTAMISHRAINECNEASVSFCHNDDDKNSRTIELMKGATVASPTSYSLLCQDGCRTKPWELKGCTTDGNWVVLHTVLGEDTRKNVHESFAIEPQHPNVRFNRFSLGNGALSPGSCFHVAHFEVYGTLHAPDC